ncbi:MAG: bifunctional tRNA (5-methylaminomethyl-2-thiouridine)(34)-methyltransferase MnmD/FAD-dependent 5-carboxymethylaminomethyl-2-thiouridine(34) oxidoreductase MnmC, partial [Gammaproteobacteria bacterium]|nr:bifunctional tRNA (5-methylaminomethyl-2-thiouridine)(34)-methyltransferase MnmD/FAD-dependent 5-carboxymethylaminomethyl-2-thiouridine(34) oxidoreductase MnmC [Gammaproteobacteria bacterium]
MAGSGADAAEPETLAIEPAAVRFDGGRPVSPVFEDIYFDADGPAETLRVFLGPAAIETRARAAELFTVAELGFGTGLNFLVTAHVAKARRLHFVSFERHPLRRDDAEKALSRWRSDYPLAFELLNAWPPALAGWHRRHFAGGRIQLSVWHGDAADGLR